MKRVWIAQCLCPQRHNIAAGIDEAAGPQEAEQIRRRLIAEVDELVDSGAINPWCGICHSPRATWRVELGRTRWKTMAEAQPELAKNQADQIAVAAVFGELFGSRGPRKFDA